MWGSRVGLFIWPAASWFISETEVDYVLAVEQILVSAAYGSNAVGLGPFAYGSAGTAFTLGYKLNGSRPVEVFVYPVRLGICH